MKHQILLSERILQARAICKENVLQDAGNVYSSEYIIIIHYGKA